jgi:3-oxoacyl-[acyl-carrier protein] reductase
LNRYDLAGKCAIVTGGAGAIGHSIGRLLAASGAAVSLWHLSPRVNEMQAEGMLARQVDVTDDARVGAAARADFEALGRIDVLVNNAGILGEIKPLWEASLDDLRRVLDVAPSRPARRSTSRAAGRPIDAGNSIKGGRT